MQFYKGGFIMTDEIPKKEKAISKKELVRLIIENNDRFDLRYFKHELYDLPRPALAGQHQYINASIAIATALTLPFSITTTVVREAAVSIAKMLIM